MKVLSIKEPWASLIMNGKKKIETRSWKTKYRGEIYIHASLSRVKIIKPEIYELIKDMNFKYGHIICKCNLVDCIYMTDEYINDMKTNHYEEYICGHYEVGRYAWVLADVKVIKPIEAKGKLGIWNYFDGILNKKIV